MQKAELQAAFRLASGCFGLCASPPYTPLRARSRWRRKPVCESARGAERPSAARYGLSGGRWVGVGSGAGLLEAVGSHESLRESVARTRARGSR